MESFVRKLVLPDRKTTIVHISNVDHFIIVVVYLFLCFSMLSYSYLSFSNQNNIKQKKFYN